MPLKSGYYEGKLYRALNPVYMREPLSGRGAQLYGGRFNSKGLAALYTALDPATALREANQVGDLQPTTLVAYRANIGPIFDTRELAGLEKYEMTKLLLGDPGWRSAMLGGRPVPTQDFAKVLIDHGFKGVLVRSFAHGASETSLNIVLWKWSDADCVFEVIDDENRLDIT